MPHDLDAKWRAEHPEPTLDDLQLQWGGVTLTRLPEVPIAAIRWADQALAAADSGLTEMVTSIKLSLNPTCHDDFDRVLEGMGLDRLMALWRELNRLSAGRPTAPASDSGTGRRDNGTPSTDDDSAKVELPSARSVIAPSSTSPTPPLPNVS